MSTRRQSNFQKRKRSRRLLGMQWLERRYLLTALSLTNAACGPAITYEVVGPDGNPVSSLAQVLLNEQGEATAHINLDARKIQASQDFFIDTDVSTGGNGLSWTTAFNDIRNAILSVKNMSIPAATFHVADGIYTWGDIGNPGFSFNIIGAGMGLTVVQHRPGDKFVAGVFGRDIYIEGMTFTGGEVDIRNTSRLTVVNSEFTRSAVRDGLNVVDVASVVAYGAVAHFNNADGFSYTNPSGRPMEVFEAFVTGSDNGLNGLWNSQGSTIHETVKIVRVGSSFERNPTNISDVSSNVGWNIDIKTADALSNQQAFQYLNYNVSGGGTGWIISGDHGQGINQPAFVNAVRTAQIRYVSKFNTLTPSTGKVSGNSFLDDSPLSVLTVPCNTTAVGALNDGIAVDDAATGRGYLFYSPLSVFTRFSENKPTLGNSEHFVAARVSDGVWQYNNDSGWHAFVPADGDRLLASIDFSARTVASLKGSNGSVVGIKRGFVSGDLQFVANQWMGSPNIGEYSVVGSQFTTAIGVDEVAPLFYPRNMKLGIAVDDAATGLGYIMFSATVVDSRFANHRPDVNNSERLIAVRIVDGQWQYNNNLGWYPLTPAADDRLIASVNFTARTISSLQGSFGAVSGINQGFASGDLGFLPNWWNGRLNSGEYTVTGTFFTVPEILSPDVGDTGGGGTTTTETTFTIGPINSGVAVFDKEIGSGYIMFSAQSLYTRFAAFPPGPGNSNQLIAVRVVNGTWQYNNNLVWHTFTPTTDDRLIASIDFGVKTMTSLQGATGAVSGINQGFAAGDLGFIANWWGGKANSGEYTVTGNAFTIVSTTGAEPIGLLAALRTTDVNSDGETTPIDALKIINRMSRGSLADPDLGLNPQDLIYDVSNDNMISAIDALLVINEISRKKQAATNTFETVPSIEIGAQTNDRAITEMTQEEQLRLIF